MLLHNTIEQNELFDTRSGLVMRPEALFFIFELSNSRLRFRSLQYLRGSMNLGCRSIILYNTTVSIVNRGPEHE